MSAEIGPLPQSTVPIDYDKNVFAQLRKDLKKLSAGKKWEHIQKTAHATDNVTLITSDGQTLAINRYLALLCFKKLNSNYVDVTVRCLSALKKHMYGKDICFRFLEESEKLLLRQSAEKLVYIGRKRLFDALYPRTSLGSKAVAPPAIPTIQIDRQIRDFSLLNINGDYCVSPLRQHQESLFPIGWKGKEKFSHCATMLELIEAMQKDGNDNLMSFFSAIMADYDWQPERRNGYIAIILRYNAMQTFAKLHNLLSLGVEEIAAKFIAKPELYNLFVYVLEKDILHPAFVAVEKFYKLEELMLQLQYDNGSKEKHDERHRKKICLIERYEKLSLLVPGFQMGLHIEKNFSIFALNPSLETLDTFYEEALYKKVLEDNLHRFPTRTILTKTSDVDLLLALRPSKRDFVLYEENGSLSSIFVEKDSKMIEVYTEQKEENIDTFQKLILSKLLIERNEDINLYTLTCTFYPKTDFASQELNFTKQAEYTFQFFVEAFRRFPISK